MTFKMCVNWDNDENLPWTCSLEPVINPDIVEVERQDHYKTNCIEGGVCAGSYPTPRYDPAL